MTDVFSRRKRSAIMSNCKGSGNKRTELAMIAIFRRYNLTGWRRQRPFFGKPDFAFPRHRVAVFVDGCFWHGCPQHASKPVSNAEFWAQKLERNRARDRRVNKTLEAAGWRVLRVWQHDLAKRRESGLVEKLRHALESK